MITVVHECIACGQRYPLVPYYKAAAPHGPDRDCAAPLGWIQVREQYPPTSNPAANERLRP
jgi:hypothetical protein